MLGKVRITSSEGEQAPKFGLLLDEAVRFKKVESSLTRMIREGFEDKEIQTILELSPELLIKFKGKIKGRWKVVEKVDFTVFTKREKTFSEFVKESTGDVYLIPWYYCNRVFSHVKEEMAETLHCENKGNYRSFHEEEHYRDVARTSLHVGKSGGGIFIQKPDMMRLLALNFKKYYPHDIVEYVRDHNLPIFKIEIIQVDKTALKGDPVVKYKVLRKGQEQNVYHYPHSRLIKCVSITVVEHMFEPLVKVRQDEVNQIIKSFDETGITGCHPIPKL